MRIDMVPNLDNFTIAMLKNKKEPNPHNNKLFARHQAHTVETTSKVIIYSKGARRTM